MCYKFIGVFFLLKNVFVLSVIILKDQDHVYSGQLEPSFKYTIDQLLMNDFPKKTSDDIYMDPCKAGMFNI